jgi:hypothetical protein
VPLRAPAILVLGAAVLTFALPTAPSAAAATRQASGASDPQAELAARYAPVVRLADTEQSCEQGQDFQPTDVNVVLHNPEVALRGPWAPQDLVTVGPTAKDISVGLPGYNLDFPGDALSPGCSYSDWAGTVAKTSPPTMYAHVATDPSYPGQLALQYWFFYLYNDFNDKHEGDWEMIQLDFNAASAEQALATSPTEVGYSQHEGAESARWGSPKLALVDGTHPVVYPALGSHANYFASALYLGRSAAQGVGCDDTNGPSRQITPNVIDIPQQSSAYLADFPWLGYFGRWGERHQSFYNGPTGPNAKERWAEPINWANTSWRDQAYALPESPHYNHTATKFFCSAVAAGSAVLTAAVGDPSPVLFGLALLVALIIWLASRTRWSPSTPLRLWRRRPWGSMVTSAYRMYVEHPRVFLGIGLLFIPIGLIAAALQSLAFSEHGLGALLTSVGATNAFVETLVLALNTLVTLLGLTLVQGATAVAMVAIDGNEPVQARTAYKGALERLRPLLRALAGAIIVCGALAFVGLGAVVAVWLVIRWSLLAQCAVIDPAPKPRPLRRSARLTKGHWWRTASITGFVTGLGLLIGPMVGVALLFLTTASFRVVDLVAALINVAVMPFIAIATTYLYADLYVREQLDEPEPVRAVLPAEV